MSPPDLGTNLWGLAVHLFRTRKNSHDAFRELVFRTGSPLDHADASGVSGVHSLRATKWYAEMSKRYEALRTSLEKQRQSDFNELAEVVKSLYPHGCSASDFADAVQTCTAMLSFTITTDQVNAFIEEKCDDIINKGLHELSAEQLTHWLVEGLLLDALVPPRWFASERTGNGPAFAVRRVGLRTQPLCLAIEYAHGKSGSMRTRSIPLEGVFSPTGPTGPVARRLFQSHGWLLTEEEIQRLLIKLQHLIIRKDDEMTEMLPQSSQNVVGSGAQSAEAPPLPMTASAAPLTDAAPPVAESPKQKRSKPQKADVTLLYRDPEAALDNVDLNDADDLTLKEFKDVMNEKFAAIAVKPGDPGYEYDRRVDAAPATQKSAWDDDSDDDEE